MAISVWCARNCLLKPHICTDFLLFQFDQFVVGDLQDVFNFDGLISSHPLYVPVNHPDEISEIFDRISYAKVIYASEN